MLIGIDLAWLLTGRPKVEASPDQHRDGVRTGEARQPARVDRELWRRVRSLVKDVYTRQDVKLPENVMDDIW